MKNQSKVFVLSFQFFRIFILSFLALSVIFSLFAARAQAAQVTLAWDPNTELDLAGYKIYYGFETGNYSYSIDVGDITSYTISGIEENRAIYLAATAYDVNGNESEYSEQVVFKAENQPPVADAGPDQIVNEGVSVNLSGINSSDPEGGILSYFWDQTGGSTVVLSDSEAAQPIFTTPNVSQDGESLTFRLTVTDDNGLSSEDYCTVNVSWVNIPPTADAGPDVTVNEGEEVVLDGFGSSDPDDGIVAYLWEQTGGPGVEILNPTDIQASFIAPYLTSGDVSLTFKLTVQDSGGLIADDTCVVNVTWTNAPPTADAGQDQTVCEGDTVTLDGSSSWDPDDGIVSVRWTQTGGSPVSLYDPTAVKTTFTAPKLNPESGPMIFQLSVTDKGGLTSQDACTINVAGDTVYEDAEDRKTYGWAVYDNNPKRARIRNVFDDQRQSRVIQLNGSGTANGYRLRNEDGSLWHNSEQFTIQWSMKYDEGFVVYLDVQTTAGHRYLYYTPLDYDRLGRWGYVHHGLGSSVTDGQWHTFTRDLQADLEDAQPGVNILEVNGFLVRGSGSMDDIQLKSR